MTREEEILCGWLKLPGRKGKSYVGKETPQWKEFPKENQDMEAVFVLNRHEHWNILMEAYQRMSCLDRKEILMISHTYDQYRHR